MLSSEVRTHGDRAKRVAPTARRNATPVPRNHKRRAVRKACHVSAAIAIARPKGYIGNVTTGPAATHQHSGWYFLQGNSSAHYNLTASPTRDTIPHSAGLNPPALALVRFTHSPTITGRQHAESAFGKRKPFLNDPHQEALSRRLQRQTTTMRYTPTQAAGHLKESIASYLN